MRELRTALDMILNSLNLSLLSISQILNPLKLCVKMETAITKGIKISVRAIYMPRESRPAQYSFYHAYRITIENLSSDTVQLLRRHWFIVDSNGSTREVEGEGVIGQQPVLQPGQSHEYSSWCPLMTDVGKMYGTFLMKRRLDNRLFKVVVPEFKLIPPFKLN